MIELAVTQVQLQHKQADGRPLRDHLMAAMQAGAVPDSRLVAQPPAHCSMLWSAYCELAGARASAGMGGVGLVPPSEVQAWQAGRGVRLSPWELDTLSAMDCAALNAAQQQSKAGKAPAAAATDAEGDE